MVWSDDSSSRDEPPRRVLGYRDPQAEQDLLPNAPAQWSLRFGLALVGLFVVLASMFVRLKMAGRAIGNGMILHQLTPGAMSVIWISWLLLSFVGAGLGVVGLLRARRPGVGGMAAALAGLTLGVTGFAAMVADVELSQW